MKKPLIGVTTSLDANGRLTVNSKYMARIMEAGGAPVLLPVTTDSAVIDEYAERIDGMLLTGGCDIDPVLFGETKLPECGEIDRARDDMEIALVLAARERGIPILGICRGIQTINVAYGGTLYQDVPSQYESWVEHRVVDGVSSVHSVELTGCTPLYELLGCDTIEVNSRHHQAVKDPGHGLEVCAVSEDGLTEALWDTRAAFVLGLQWHPELLDGTDGCTEKIFAGFIAACKE